jgi:endonuclease YncB( thermonuclease family)
MLKTTWIFALFATALLSSCNRVDTMPANPYDLPRADERDVIDVNLDGAILGHSISARRASDDAPFTIHLADIFAPAKGQTWHSESVAALNALAQGKRARLRIYESIAPPEDAQEFGVTVIGRVYLDGKDLSWELVGSGNAWVWDKKSNDPELKKLQDWARENRKGLWALPESQRVPPWEFMREQMRLHMQQPEGSRPD